MSFEIKTRYGYSEVYDDTSETVSIIENLIEELETEENEEPDDEHTQIAVCFGDLSITVQVSGLITLDNLGKDEEPVHLRDLPREEVIILLTELAKGNIPFINKHKWLPYEKLPPYKKDFFRQTRKR